MSPKSRLRLLRLLARVKWLPDYNKFITLTFPDSFPDARGSKDVYRRFAERMRRAYPEMAWVWRMELQQRGAPHFHMISPFRTYVPKELVQRLWSECVGGDRLFTRIESFKGKKTLLYIAKYIAKKESVQIWPVDKTNRTQVSEGSVAEDESLGRCWGVHNRPRLPLHDAISQPVSPHEYSIVLQFLKERFPHLDDRNLSSVSVFVSKRDLIDLAALIDLPDEAPNRIFY